MQLFSASGWYFREQCDEMELVEENKKKIVTDIPQNFSYHPKKNYIILYVNCSAELYIVMFLREQSSCQNEAQSRLAEASGDQDVPFVATDPE